MWAKAEEFVSFGGVVVLLVVVTVMVVVFQWRNAEMRRFAGGQKVVPLDGKWKGYSPEEAAQLFNALGSDGRKFYALSELTLDLVFPLAYGALLAMLASLLWAPPWRLLFIGGAVLAVVADWVENVLIAYLALTYTDGPQPLAHVANGASLLKWCLVAAVSGGIGIGALIRWLAP